MVTCAFLFTSVLFVGFEMQPKQNVPSALPSHTSAKHPWPSFFSRNNEWRATSQASLANPEVCGVQLDEITVKLKHKPSAFSTGEGINKENTVLIIQNHACTRKDGRWRALRATLSQCLQPAMQGKALCRLEFSIHQQQRNLSHLPLLLFSIFLRDSNCF